MIKRSSIAIHKNIKYTLFNNLYRYKSTALNYTTTTTTTVSPTTTTSTKTKPIKSTTITLKQQQKLDKISELQDTITYLQSLDLTINNQKEKKIKLVEIDEIFNKQKKSAPFQKLFSKYLPIIINLNLEFNNIETCLKYLNHFKNEQQLINHEIYHCFHSILIGLVNNNNNTTKEIEDQILSILTSNKYLLKEYIKSKNFIDLLNKFNSLNFINQIIEYLSTSTNEEPINDRKEILLPFIHYFLDNSDLVNANKLNQQYKSMVDTTHTTTTNITTSSKQHQDNSFIHFKYIEYYYKINDFENAISLYLMEKKNYRDIGGIFIIYQSLFEMAERNNKMDTLKSLVLDIYEIDWKQIPFLLFYNGIKNQTTILKHLTAQLKNQNQFNQLKIIDSLTFMLLKYNRYDKVLEWVSFLICQLNQHPSNITIKNIMNYHYFRKDRVRYEIKLQQHWHNKLNEWDTIESTLSDRNLSPPDIIKPHSPFKILDLIKEYQSTNESKLKSLGYSNNEISNSTLDNKYLEYVYINSNYQSIYQFNSTLLKYIDPNDKNTTKNKTSTKEKGSGDIDNGSNGVVDEIENINDGISSDIYDLFDISTSFNKLELDSKLKSLYEESSSSNKAPIEIRVYDLIIHLKTNYFQVNKIPPGEQLLISLLEIKKAGYQFYKQFLQVAPEYIKVLTFNSQYLSTIKHQLDLNEFLNILSLESESMVSKSATTLNILLSVLLRDMKINDSISLVEFMVSKSIPIREHKSLGTKLHRSILLDQLPKEIDILSFLKSILENQQLDPSHVDAAPIYNCILLQLLHSSDNQDTKQAFKLYHSIQYKNPVTFNTGVRIYSKMHPHVGVNDLYSFVQLWDTLFESSKDIPTVTLFDYYEELFSIFYSSGFSQEIKKIISKNNRILKFSSVKSMEIILNSYFKSLLSNTYKNTSIIDKNITDGSNSDSSLKEIRANEMVSIFFKFPTLKFYPQSILELLLNSNQFINNGEGSPKLNEFLKNYKPVLSIGSKKLESKIHDPINEKNRNYLNNLLSSIKK